MSMPSVFVKCQIGHVDVPLEKISTFAAFDLTVGVIDVPRQRFGCDITGVQVRLTSPSEAGMTVAAVRRGNVWTATFPAEFFAASGVSHDGVTVSATGTDEKGAAATWILGKGDLEVKAHDGSVEPGEDYQVLHWYNVAPSHPQGGDVAPIDGVAKVWSGSAWIDLGGGGGGAGATVLTIEGGKLVKDGEEIATFNDLLALVRSGGVVLMGTVGSQKDALFYPLYCDTTAIRFDATGTLGNDIQTKSYTMQPNATGGIRIGEGSTTVLAKKSDITWNNLSGKPELDVAGRTVRNFNREAVDNTAILTAFKIPQALADRAGDRTITKIRMQGPTTATGSWDSQNVNLRFYTDDGIFSKLAAASGPIEVGKPIEFLVSTGFVLSNVDDLTFSVFSANNRSKFGLVSVDPSEGYDLTLSNGNHLTNFAPFLEFELAGGEIVTTYAKAVGDKVEKAGAAKLLAANASQSQIIAKVNELISSLK